MQLQINCYLHFYNLKKGCLQKTTTKSPGGSKWYINSDKSHRGSKQGVLGIVINSYGSQFD